MKIIVTTTFLVCFSIGIAAMYAAWQHNPQCEYHCEGVIFWDSLLPVGVSWFLVTFPGMLAVFIPAYLVARKRK